MTIPTEIEYELTGEELDRLLNASKPVPYIVIGGHIPMSPQEHANNAWAALGSQRGFDWTTVRAGSDDRHFWAVPTS